MTRKSKTTPGFGQYLLGFILGALAITAGGISLVMNVNFGLHASLLMAAIFAVSDLAKIILPMATAALGGWNLHRKAVYAVAVIISIIAAISFLLETQASRLLASQSAQKAVTTAQADASRIRQELAQITERGDVASLTALHNEAQAKADREAGRGGCGSKCEAAKAEAAELLVSLSEAKRRAELERRLAETKQALSATKVEALGASDTLAALTGGDRDQIATHEAMVKSILMLIVLELIAALSGAAGNIVTSTWRARKAKAKTKTPKADDIQTEADEISSKKAAPSYWMKRLSKDRPDIASRVIAGEISCYEGCIQAGIRKRATNKWTKIDSYVQPVEA